MTLKQALVLAGFIALVFCGGLLIGITNAPGEWYAGLVKPGFNPPNWIFGPVWSVLYVMIGIAGWRAWRVNAHGPLAMAWWVQLGLNFLWSPVFFTLHRIDLALVVILLLLGAILTFLYLGWKKDRLAAMLMLPYAAWVSFASVLNGSILALN